MPHGNNVASTYVCPRWLWGAHAQTVWPLLQTRARVACRRERVATPDGDFWHFDWLESPAQEGAPLLVLFHGLEGNSHSHYAQAMLAAAARRGWRGVVPHFRGCSGELNLQPRAYHMGDHGEVAAMLAAVRARVPQPTTLCAVGVSLGGSALLHWLGRNGKEASAMLAAAAAVSTPVDLEASGRVFGKGINRLYEFNFMRTLKRKALAMAKRHPDKLNLQRIAAARTLDDFDEALTAPLHGFEGVADYRRRASPRPWLCKIETPTLLLNALNDSLVPAAFLPGVEEASPFLFFERPEKGGHAGFPTAGDTPWMPQRVLDFFGQHTGVGE